MFLGITWNRKLFVCKQNSRIDFLYWWSCCHVDIRVPRPFLAVLWVRLWFVIVEFPCHTHLLFGSKVNQHWFSIAPLTQHCLDLCSRCVFFSLPMWIFINSFIASSDFCRLLITFAANGLDPDQDRQNVGPDQDPNHLTLWYIVFLKDALKKKNIF